MTKTELEKQLYKIKKGIHEAINLASSQNKAIEQIVGQQYKLLKNLTLQLQIIQQLNEEYLKENQ